MKGGAQANRRAVSRWVLIALALSAGPLVRLSAVVQCPDGSPPPCRAPAARTTPAPPNSVAVLYFENLSRDTADAYLADGLTEQFIERLAQIERLVVKSRNAVRRYRGTAPASPAALGRALGATYLVSGNVRRARNRLRVTVELERAASGVRLWGQHYDRADVDLLAIEEEIARAVASAIAGRLLQREQASLGYTPTRSPRAYDHLLRGNYHLAQRTPRAATRAIAEYEASARIDSDFIEAHARVGYGYALFLDWGWEFPGLSAESLYARGLAAARHALRVDSTVADGWMALGYLRKVDDPRTYEGAKEAFKQAVALDPRSAEAWHQYGSTLRELGDDSGAIAASLQALALEPGRSITLHQLASVSTNRREFERALCWLDSALAVDPGFSFGYVSRSRVHRLLGQLPAAKADAETARRLAGDYRLPADAVLASVKALLGDTVTAQTLTEHLLAEAAHPDYLTPFEAGFVGMAFLALGSQDQALTQLERARPRGASLWFVLQWPEFDVLRPDPRFQRLVEESRPPDAPR
ncbi:MAG: tetratricopeptide repeat protein [Gemmatimonadales bacterium]